MAALKEPSSVTQPPAPLRAAPAGAPEAYHALLNHACTEHGGSTTNGTQPTPAPLRAAFAGAPGAYHALLNRACTEHCGSTTRSAW